jgi:NAD(P)H-dependent FMN reductase
MKISIISGSHRKNSESEKVARYIIKEIHSKLAFLTHFVSLAENPIPLFDEDFFNPNSAKWNKAWAPIAQELQSSDGIIIISPEWHGMVPSGLKNFLLLSSAKELGHKPGLIVSVSAGTGGAYPVLELRSSGYKNSRICYIPEHVIVRDCTHVLNHDTPESKNDTDMRERIEYALNIFAQYMKALKLVRDSGTIDHANFPNGM